MSEPTVTPLPWRVAYLDAPDIKGADGRVVACVSELSAEQNEANAAFIVTACNSHAALLEACKRMTGYLADLNGSEWIKGDSIAAADMRQRAKALQQIGFNVTAKADPSYDGLIAEGRPA